MARIRSELQLHRADILDVALATVTEVILHIAAAARRVRVAMMSQELLEQRLIRFVEKVREHIQPSAVRHADQDRPRAGVRAALDRFVDHRHEGVHTLDRKPLHVHEGETEKPLEAVDLRETLQHASLLLRRERRSNASLFYRASEPVPFRLVLERIELKP